MHPTGQRVVVHALGETPMDAVERHVTLEPQPWPTSLRPDDVVVEVRSAAVGWVDLLMTSGQYQHAVPTPYTPGMEYAGVVAWAGPEATVAVGDRVIADGLKTGPRSSGPHQRQGGLATWAVAPSHALVAVPDRLTFDQACHFLGSYETAWHVLVQCGDVQPTDTVLVHGATGATGLAAVQVAKVLGATVIATGRSAEKLAVVRRYGADHVLAVADAAGGVRRFRDDVKALTGGRGADVVYDPVGGAISLESLRCVRFGARFLIVGWAATPFVARGKGRRGAPNANVLPTNLIMMKGLVVRGCPTVIATRNDPEIRDRRLSQLIGWAQAGRLVPHVGHAYPLAEARDALRAKWESRHVGAVVVHPAR